MEQTVAVMAALDALRELGEAQEALRRARGSDMRRAAEQTARALGMARAVTSALVASGRGL